MFYHANAQKVVPFVVAHRGNSSLFPENTMISFQSAVNMHADFIEMDLWMSKDSIPIIMHDETLGRTTNVEQVFGSNKKISELTEAEIKTLYIDGGYGFSDDYGDRLRVPTFEEVVRTFGNKIGLFLNIKDWRNEHIQKIIKILRTYDISPLKVMLETRGRYNSTEFPRWATVLKSESAHLNPIELKFVNNQLFCDSSYFISIPNIYISKDELNISFNFRIDGLHKSYKYLFEIGSVEDSPVRYGTVRLGEDYNLEFSFKTTSGLVNSIARIDTSKPHQIQYSFKNGLFFLAVDNNVVWSRYFHNTAYLTDNIQLSIGSDLNGQYRFFGFLNNFSISSNGRNIIDLGLNKSLDKNGESNISPIVLDFPISADLYNIETNGYTSQMGFYLSSLQKKIGLWTVNDVKEMENIISGKQIQYVFTDYPQLLLQKIQSYILYTQINNRNNNSEFHIDTYPNPSSKNINITLTLPEDDEIDIRLYDIIGRMVYHFPIKHYSAGINSFQWDGKDKNGINVRPGVYIFSFQTSRTKYLKKILIIY